MTQQKAAAENLDDFAQWATENVLPFLSSNISDEEAGRVAISMKEFEKNSSQDVTESKVRNLLPHRDEKHVHLTKILNVWRNMVPTPVNSMHCKNAETWITKRLFPIIGKGEFTKNEALEVVHKLKRKEREDKWTVTPENLIMTVTSKNLADMGLEFKNFKERVELIESYMAA